jgi:hypothetical protein
VSLLEILKNSLETSTARFSCFYPHLNFRAMLGMFGRGLLPDLLPPLPLQRQALETVRDHFKAIFDKVGVRSRRELVGQVFAQSSTSRV